MAQKSLYLITGGDGFIGSHIAENLLKKGHKVRVFDNMSARGGQNCQYLAKLSEGELEVLEGDLRNEADCAKALDQADFVFHLAALGSIPRSVDNPLRTHAVNATGTLNLLNAARDAKVKRFVHSSSSSVYGEQLAPEGLLNETAPTFPMSPYGVSKVAAEHYVRVFHTIYGLPTVALRYFNVFGPRQDPNGAYAAVIPKFIAAILKGEAPTIFGDGGQSRDFTFVANVVQANLKAITSERAVGRVINVATGANHTVLEVAQRINQILGKDIRPVFSAKRPGEIRHTLADIGRALGLLGYEVKVSFSDGLEMTVAALRDQ
jgi:nucleoside-diphosphate-sugar epimerase